jgi:tripartite-type tricarboxylate transporter receptor subunit TctC
MPRTSFSAAVVAGLVALSAPAAFSDEAAAQTYPTQPIKLVVPFAPGGGSDALGRITAEGLSKALGQPVVVENKPGAASVIGTDYVLKSKPDGYTLLFSASDSASLVPALRTNMPYKSPDDFAFIGQVSGNAFYIVVNPGLPIHNMAELVAYAKANPGKLRFGTSGNGSAPHMASALVAKTVGIEVTNIHYGGGGQALAAVMGGHVDAVYGPPAIKSAVESGKVRAIATTAATRHRDFPDTPTLAESGIRDLVISIWYGVLAPAATPEPVLTRLREALAEMMKDPSTAERLEKIGFVATFLPHDQFKDFVTKDLARWKDVAKSANIKIE